MKENILNDVTKGDGGDIVVQVMILPTLSQTLSHLLLVLSPNLVLPTFMAYMATAMVNGGGN